MVEEAIIEFTGINMIEMSSKNLLKREPRKL
jgi:hypothetical protein